MRIENGKKIPEVGDVWKLLDSCICRICYFCKWSDNILVFMLSKGSVWYHTIKQEELDKYLGKAKNSLESIFEVEE